MGTHATIKFYEEYKKDDLAFYGALYYQYDGYPENVGLKLAQFLNDTSLVNGIGPDSPKNQANGIGCLAAQYISQEKTKAGVGGVYMTFEDDAQEFDYVVICNAYNNDTEVVALEHGELFFKGDPQAFLDFCNKSTSS